MLKKTKTSFVCNSCGETFSKWLGRCLSCGQWDTIVEFRESKATPAGIQHTGDPVQPVLLPSCKTIPVDRIPVGFAEIDRVFGGGLVPGSVSLLAGSPGIGKSTIAIQIAAYCCSKGLSVLYVSGEESIEQVTLRARRIGIADVPIQIIAQTCVESIIT
ncbi:MAG: AAA family ATPase, partial [Chitinivibrionales bacterium]|nr:AAA family ATPase [Chitinivibrionales bacterium]